MRPGTPALEMSDGQREVLAVLSRSLTVPVREVQRAKALLLAADGMANSRVAAELRVSPATVAAWRARFASEGLAKLGKVRKGRGRKATIPRAKIEEILELTKSSKPDGETHWSCRSMAAKVGVSKATVQRVWSARGLKPHLVKTFKVSNDPKFEEKLIDVVGLYLDPPENAVVLCMDEKSSVQALDRTQPSPPMVKGRAGTMTHDYQRHGTTTLFAALDVLTGHVTGTCMPRHRHEEFVKFLTKIDKEVPNGLAVHVVLDNYSAHKHKDVGLWLADHQRFHLHFTPTSSSWLNLVVRWFRELTDNAIRRGVFRSVPDLIAKIEEYLAAHNAKGTTFVWTATAEQILDKVARGRVSGQASTKLRHTTSCASIPAAPLDGRIAEPVAPSREGPSALDRLPEERQADPG